ncbi:hypothetical protein [Campylobacter upsaliensis]|uniref:hypothetical protein n=1 Tax=Campylobacter upsaliensis TaxID=28080 RepID=UPI00004B375E|nr:hypothetical protein [Campylobacter upsaliensis]EAL52242.1 hypothetical protein CUPA0014 [Campylobacter upsaliensis RM3195]MCR2108548.1 hypothetical protein [Campylobacter upsaliensis]MCR2113463.1 hypothetical protein [Campylobacter upsaliensis]MCR2120039.1 hypothetical protein [Campylobacter upsaliensis]MCR2123840.1 hypothetical protein [Campylobacter upsaliensis]
MIYLNTNKLTHRYALAQGYHQLLILFSALKAIISEFTSAFRLSFIELYEQITKEGK